MDDRFVLWYPRGMKESEVLELVARAVFGKTRLGEFVADDT